MFFLLHRYLMKELLRVFFLATVALTLMLSAGLLVPMIKEYGVSPRQMLSLIGDFCPITLTFVIPMGALFSAAITYGRFAADRELDACRASGIAFRTLIQPGFSLALAAALANLLLSFHITPAFVHRSEYRVRADAKQILFRNIQRKGYWDIPGGRYKIYAEQAVPADNLLLDVVILDIQKNKPPRMITARQAIVDIETRREHHSVTVITEDTIRFDENQPVRVGTIGVSRRVPPLLADKIKFQKIEQLKQIQADKLQFGPIYDLALTVRAQTILERLAEEGRQTLKKPQEYIRFRSADGGREYLLRAGGLEVNQERRIDLTGPVRLLEILPYRNNEVYCRYESDRGQITLEDDRIDRGLELILETPQWQLGGGVKGTALQKAIPELPIPEAILEGLQREKLLGTLTKTDSSGTGLGVSKPSRILQALQTQLREQLVQVDNQLTSEIHSRLVLGLGCIPLIVTGICLGILFRGGHILSAFGASTIPGALLIVFILSGKQLTKNPAAGPEVGIAVMWGGLVLLTMLAWILYRKISRV
ncbi:MAG TPA: LptF/LptG family permease [Anaerohalosphaeraceae bacterium]|nr:LptF/LptG family permease [Anaerohalosphaeraceae bacterium]HOL87733.1 LptF/LptG family permease [Anaerohalosphaeraceae bacterium]HPP55760.1 LptF/LptG family permease [Anaerohalosphaeraceae bacterium]